MANIYTGKTLEFTCVPLRLLFENKDNGYKIYSVSVDFFEYPDVYRDPKYRNTCIAGDSIFDLEPETKYIVKAKEVNTDRGIRYDVINIETKPLSTPGEKHAYLSKVLTPLQARTLLTEYPDIIEDIMNNPDFIPDFSRLKGITENNFNRIKTKIIDNFQFAGVCGIFYNTMSLAIIKRLFTNYKSVDILKKSLSIDPYQTLCSVKGIGFKKADEICLSIEDESYACIRDGKKPSYKFPFSVRDSILRCRACMVYCIDELESSEGSTRINLEDLKAKVYELIGDTSKYFSEVLTEKSLFHYDEELETVSSIKTYKQEKFIVDTLLKATQNNIDWNYQGDLVTHIGKDTLTDEQIQTQKELLNNNVVLLTGSAGCGKSFSMKGMISMLDMANKSYLLLSPTAKAAKVLSAATGRESATIHRGLLSDGTNFGRNSQHPITHDVVIVDEFSMVDTDLFYHLLQAIDFEHTKLLLIFDPAQLASVGPGNIAYDLVQSKLFSVVALDKIFRYSEGGLITVATDTRNCLPFLPKNARFEPVKFGNSFAFFPEDNDMAVELAVDLYENRLESGDTSADVVVLSAQNKGPQGVVTINEMIQDRINPQPQEARIQFKREDGQEVEYRLNDVVMQTANDYQSIVCTSEGLFRTNEKGEPVDVRLIANGETGTIVKVDPAFVVIYYGDCYIYRDKIQLQRTQLGYAITCHKSQGSGYKDVIVVAPASHTWQLNSNLLYVAFTRAKQHCWCVGDIDAVNKAVKKKMEVTRKTNISILLKKNGGRNNV